MNVLLLVLASLQDTKKNNILKSIVGDTTNLLNDENSEYKKESITRKRLCKIISKFFLPKFPLHRPSFVKGFIGDICFGDNSCFIQDDNDKSIEIIFVNGILMDMDAVLHIQKLLRNIFNHPISLFYNASDSIIPDLFECLLNKSTNMFTEASLKLFMSILSILLNPKIKKLICIGHSQGTILLSSVLNNLKEICMDDKYLQKLELYLFSNCSTKTKYINTEKKLPYIENISNENDFVSRLGMLSSNKSLIDIDGKYIIIKKEDGHLFGANYLSGEFEEKYRESKLLEVIKRGKKNRFFFAKKIQK